MDLIRIKNAEKKYKNGVTAIRNLNLDIEKGSFTFVIGGSGSGKSTLIKMLYREERPTQGKIKLGIVFQDYRLLPKLTVYENVAFAMEVIGAKKNETRLKVLKALEEVGLKNKVHNYPDQLSGGEQQRVAIARAIVNNPKLLLCDEPTGNLDPEKSMEIMAVLDKINKVRGTTIIMATHDKEIVNKMKKQVITLKDGRLVSFKKKGTYYDEDVENAK